MVPHNCSANSFSMTVVFVQDNAACFIHNLGFVVFHAIRHYSAFSL
jgi:hypothetical protein